MECEGIVLRVTPYQEKDAIVNVLTEQGYVSFKARGVFAIDSKNAGLITLYNHASFDLAEGKAGYTLKTGVIKHGYGAAFSDLIALSVLAMIGELTNRVLGENEDALIIYPYLIETLQALSQGNDPLTLVMLYMTQVFKISGYGLEVGHCVFCEATKDIVALSYTDGGYVCRKCYDEESMTKKGSRYLNILRFAFLIKPSDITRVSFTQKEVLDILSEFKIYLYDALSIDLKSYTMLLKAIVA